MVATEQRLALVLNGGVSLAIWMGGVVHEINSLRLISSADAGSSSSGPSAASRAAWREILERVGNPPIIVDLIAGTSAGGLNGAVLANAIAFNREMPDMRSCWVQLGSLNPSTLLNDNPIEAKWGLDADFFENQITPLLGPDRSQTAPVEVGDITLLTTATAVGNESISEADALGNAYVYKDSRRVFQFRSRSAAPLDSEFLDTVTLALAARASATYPVAFKPVEETEGL